MATSRTGLSELDFSVLDSRYARIADMTRLEGRFDSELKHLATKNDVQVIKTDLLAVKSELQSMIFKMTGAIAVFITVILAIFEFIIN